MLKIEKINTFFGLSQILFNISLDILQGEIISILGRNGVGKSTIMKSIIGISKPRSGKIRFLNKDITGLEPHKIFRHGIGYVPEDRIIFPDLTVLENLQIGKRDTGNNEMWTEEKIFQLFPVLEARLRQMGGTLSGGEQQMLALARSLMSNPQLLLLDEPSEGLAPLLAKDLFRQIESLVETGITILLSEQNVKLVFKVAVRIYIIEKGHVAWKGSTKDLQQNSNLIKQYIGI